MKRKLLIAWAGAGMMALCLLFGNAFRDTAHAQTAPIYGISVEVGYDGQYVSYRRVPVCVTVDNRAEDFVGTVELLFPDNDSKILCFKEELVLAAGESKEVRFYTMMPLGDADMTVRLVDREGEVKNAISVDLMNAIGTGTLMVGILSDRPSAEYLTGQAGSIWTLNLEETHITTAEEMGMLDVIIVDQFELDRLERGKITELEEWVKQGGTLVLGTGSYYNQTLQAFSSEFLSGKIGNLTELSYVYRAGAEPDVLPYCPLTIEGAECIYEEEGNPIIWQVMRGKGSVLVSTISLQLASWLQDSLGNKIDRAVYNHISTDRRARLDEETNGGYVYYLDNVLSQGNQAKMPNIPLYAIVLGCYVIIVGPVLYLILRKIDKRHYMWLAVPVASLVFAGVIYLLGTPTRIREPYMSYASFIDYRGDEVKEKTYFRLTAPYNRTYDVLLDNSYQVAQIRTWGYSSYHKGRIYSDYQVGISRDENGTDIELKNPAAFESFSFSAEKTGLKSTANLPSDLVWNEDDSITGSFTNQMGCDLEKVFLMVRNSIYYIGSAAKGETVAFDTKNLLSGYSSTYNTIDNSGFLEQVFDYDYYRNSSQSQKYYALNYYLNNHLHRNQEIAFLAIPAESEDGVTVENLVANTAMDHYGVNVLLLPAEAEGNSCFEYTIDSYISEFSEGQIDLPYSRHMMNRIVEIEYDFSACIPTSLMYQASYNNECQGMGYNYFVGTVFFLNQQTGDYDVIFESGRPGVCKDLTPYLVDGRMTIRYEVEEHEFENQRYDIVIPILSMKYEEPQEQAETQESLEQVEQAEVQASLKQTEAEEIQGESQGKVEQAETQASQEQIETAVDMTDIEEMVEQEASTDGTD